MSTYKISLNFKPNATDYRRVLLWYQRKRIAIVVGLTLAILSAIIFFISRSSPRNAQNDIRPALYATLVIMPFFIGGFIYFGIWKQAKKIEDISEDTSVTFDEKGVKSVSESSSSQVIWNRFQKIVETSHDFVFFPQENVFYAIPKRFFESDAQVKNLRLLLVENLGTRAQLKG